MTKTFFALAALLCGIAHPAVAQDGRHGNGHTEFHSWYEGLRDYKGDSCCNDQDCRPSTHKANPDGTIEVMVDGNWMTVPPQTILKKSAPDLGTHVCATQTLPGYPAQIICVVLGNGV